MELPRISDGGADPRELKRAAERRRPLARAVTIARGNALGYVVFGGGTCVLAVFGPDWLGLAVGMVVLGVGLAQRRTAPRLLGEPGAARALARNELVLLAAVVLYCALELTVVAPPSVGLEAGMKSAGTAGFSADGLGELADQLNRLVYWSFLAATLLYQGGLALYFARRAPLAASYLAEVPAWARETLDALE